MRWLLSLQRSGEHDARRGTSIGKQFFNEPLQLIDRRQNDLQEKSVASSEVMALLNGIQRGKKFQKLPIPGAFTGQAHKRRDRKTKGRQVDLSAIAANNIEALQTADALCRRRGRESNASSQLCYRKPRVSTQLLQYLSVDGIGSVVLQHRRLCS